MEEKISVAVQQKKCFIFGLEHELVYTAGLKTSHEHILEDVHYVKSRRGGSITVHNPGQLVFYTIVPLNQIERDLERYIRLIEVSMIRTLYLYGINAFQNDEHTGVWTNRGKIGFIGIAAKKGAVYHGAALNVKNNMADYKPILSCGLDLPITRMIDEPDVSPENLSLPEISQMWYEIYLKMMNENFNL